MKAYVCRGNMVSVRSSAVTCRICMSPSKRVRGGCARRFPYLWITRGRRAGGPRFGKAAGDRLMFHPSPGNAPERQADVAQLVAHHLAKVRVAGSNPVVRSERPPQVTCGVSSVEWPRGEATACKAVYTGSNPVSTSAVRSRAIGAAGARFLDTEEVTGSIPVSPTR